MHSLLMRRLGDMESGIKDNCDMFKKLLLLLLLFLLSGIITWFKNKINYQKVIIQKSTSVYSVLVPVVTVIVSYVSF